MATTHLDLYVDKIKLNNQSGTVCRLTCRYKDGVDGEHKKAGQTEYFPVGKSESLDLNPLEELNALYAKGREVWVTAHADVKAGKDDYTDVWAKYRPSSERCAEFTISGVINFTDVGYNGVTE